MLTEKAWASQRGGFNNMDCFVREPIGREGPSALHAQITVDEEPPVDVAEGEEVEIAGARWRVVELVEDPAHQRGDVVLERTQD